MLVVSHLKTLIALDDIVLGLSNNQHSAVERSLAAVRQRIPDNLAFRDVLNDEPGSTASADISQFVVENIKLRSLQIEPSLTRSSDGVVADGHIPHGRSEDVDAIREDVCDYANVRTSNDVVVFHQYVADMWRSCG